MKISISAYVVWFYLASLAGWLHESLYSVVRFGKWDRRGFLFGPLCPIYGTGVVAGLLLFNRPEVANGTFPPWGVFITSMVGSAVLEYSVSVALERMFGAVWWDYSNMPLNLNGRICLPASLLFGAGGLLVAYVLAPIVNVAALHVAPVVFEVLALVIVAFVSADTTATVISLSDLMEKIVGLDKSVNDYAEERVEQAASRIGSVRDSAVRKVDEVYSSQHDRLTCVAGQLTAHQVRLLSHVRRFRSEDLRNKAEALRHVLAGGRKDE